MSWCLCMATLAALTSNLLEWLVERKGVSGVKNRCLKVQFKRKREASQKPENIFSQLSKYENMKDFKYENIFLLWKYILKHYQCLYCKQVMRAHSSYVQKVVDVWKETTWSLCNLIFPSCFTDFKSIRQVQRDLSFLQRFQDITQLSKERFHNSFTKWGEHGMSLSRTNTALCRDLIVHMEISLFFFLAAATWEQSGKLHCTYLAAELCSWVNISPTVSTTTQRSRHQGQSNNSNIQRSS